VGKADIVRGFYEAVEGGDLAGGLALLAPDCSWTEMDGLASGGTYHGPDEVREGVFFRIGSEWDGFRLTVDDVLDTGDSVVAVGTYAGTCKATGRELEARVVHVFDVNDGAIAAFEQFTDTARIAAAKAS
jgi:ketosteroid isomerase-like protein